MRHHERPADDHRSFAPVMITLTTTTGAVLFPFVTGAAAADRTPAPQQSVVGDRDIRQAIDAGIDQADGRRPLPGPSSSMQPRLGTPAGWLVP